MGDLKPMTREGNCLLNATHYTWHTCFLPMMGNGKFSPGAFVLSVHNGNAVVMHV